MPHTGPGTAARALFAGVERYYSDKVRAHGPTPHGVDWSDERTQHLRFRQLLRVCEGHRGPFSLNDFGCGYGALLAYLARWPLQGEVDYLGIDLSAPMVETARRLHPHARFAVGHAAAREADYTVASGVFNVKLDTPLRTWTAYVRRTLRHLHAVSRRGFAVNFLAPRPAHQPEPKALYRPDPAAWLAFCREDLRCQVDLRADYGLGEYTLLVQRPVTPPG